jgi:hypothetical protein
MARRGRRSGPKTVWDRVKDFDPNFAAEINGLTTEALKTKLVTFADEDDKTEKAREEDPDLKSLREELKTAGETYSVPLKRNKLRRKLVLETLSGRGQL